MKEIKFRAPDKKTGTLIHFTLGDIDSDYHPGTNCFIDLEMAEQFIGNIHENPELMTLPNNISKQTEEV